MIFLKKNISDTKIDDFFGEKLMICMEKIFFGQKNFACGANLGYPTFLKGFRGGAEKIILL